MSYTWARFASTVFGDYAVGPVDAVYAAVERKSLEDFQHSLIDGSLGFAMGELGRLLRAAVAVEARFGTALRTLHGPPGYVGDLIARLQVLHPSIPIVFCDARPLAEKWTYRYLTAALTELRDGPHQMGLGAVQRVEGRHGPVDWPGRLVSALKLATSRT